MANTSTAGGHIFPHLFNALTPLHLECNPHELRDEPSDGVVERGVRLDPTGVHEEVVARHHVKEEQKIERRKKAVVEAVEAGGGGCFLASCGRRRRGLHWSFCSVCCSCCGACGAGAASASPQPARRLPSP